MGISKMLLTFANAVRKNTAIGNGNCRKKGKAAKGGA
jgi:hypothetical protein